MTPFQADCYVRLKGGIVIVRIQKFYCCDALYSVPQSHMALKGHKVIEVMKNKIDKFNKDEELRDMAYKRSLNRWANEQDKQDMYEKGKEKGIIEKNREKTKQLFKKYYPDENPDILDNLNNEQYDRIFEMILDNCSVAEIKEMIK